MRQALITTIIATLSISLLIDLSNPALATRTRTDMAKQVGDRVPTFTLATSQDRLADYNTDYYGQYHLILTFVPAAFTPV